MGSKKRLLICLCFNGTAYCGWQVQKNGLSIQSVVQNAIYNVLKFKFDIVACSRTDSGVHANKFFFHMDLNINIELEKFKFALNNKLPNDIAVNFIKIVPSNFHARYSATKKEYIYKIWNSKIKNPFLDNLVWHYNRTINVQKMNMAGKILIGRHNFASFCCVKSTVTNKVRTLYKLKVKKVGELIIFQIVGDGFLHKMVRIMVGTLISVSEELIKISDIKKILDSKNRKLAGRTVPACGLYLNDVFY